MGAAICTPEPDSFLFPLPTDNALPTRPYCSLLPHVHLALRAQPTDPCRK